ncbi:MAG: FAD binding domain-containing protein [Alphaproteobacteria bacterium]|nr:FAD binding domain-containing protein [Alphaproteobacteria bacterium]MBU0798115.1 FAD binding domain-containing protein [Alphaproteobacteria bacterium]MBU0887068.1 FAD binding domain-containing protein [Alphaproteobacteria bacterium]MBU1814318.1 FAD binding domain-containing protein [Alphaproteobacteria bacterium]
MKPAAFDYNKPADLAAALHALSGDAKPIAGGQSLTPMLNLRLARPAALVDIRRQADLLKISEAPDAIRYGAALPHAAFEDGAVPDGTNGMMRHVAGGIAYRAVRNRGTIGGSIAHADPAADWISALLALDARVIVQGAKGETAWPLDRFMLGGFTTVLEAGDLITGVSVPRLSPSARWAYYKICRKTGEFAKAIGAVVSDPDRGVFRIVCGAIEVTPILLEARSVEAALAEIDSRLADHAPAARQLYKTAMRRALEGLGETSA